MFYDFPEEIENAQIENDMDSLVKKYISCLYFMGILDFSGGFKSLCFVIEAGSIEALNA